MAFALAFLVLLPGCAATASAPPVAADTPPSIAQGTSPFPPGYLGGGALPGGLDLVPPPPAEGSAALARDKEGAAAAVTLRGSPRWDLATADADLHPGRPAAAFSCTAGFPIDKDHAPALDRLLGRAMVDLGMATGEVKKRYMRARPFMENGQPSCTPDREDVLRRDGSYPSGHSSIGYGTSLILAEILPDRAAALVARGRAFGDSRRICNAHWLSDIEEGRVVATATVMRLNADPSFAADLAAARAEAAKLRAQPAADMPDCAKEAQALAR
ncbi:acid phosphatase [Sphingobium chlorophenolicum]|nr:phosphatase PAP2 family protein [Sphingobium chlorophenolicum]